MTFASIRRLLLGALIASGALVATPVLAEPPGQLSYCTDSPCEIPEADWNYIYYDYTIVPDGHAYRWDFRYTSEDPNAWISLDIPNEVYTYGTRRDESGNFDFVLLDWGHAPYSMVPVSRWPGVLSYVVRGSVGYDHCSSSTPLGALCAVGYVIWGNATTLSYSSQAPIYISATVTAVPEPWVWVLMLTGLAAVGVTLRSRRGLRATRCAV